MRSKNYVLYSLIILINSSQKETNDTVIARALVENRFDLDSMSMESLASMCHVSQPTVSRFIKKLGFGNFNELKHSLAVSNFAIQNDMKNLHDFDVKEAVDHIYEQITGADQEILSLDHSKVRDFVRNLESYNKIVFLGSAFSISLSRMLQNKLLSQGKSVYTIQYPDYQNEIIPSLDEETLLVCISVAGRWLEIIDRKALTECAAKKILLAGHPCDYRKNGFHLMYTFSSLAGDLGYHSLMNYILLINSIL